MEVYINGEKINGVKHVDYEIESKDEPPKAFSLPKEYTLSLKDAEVNVRLMSNETRKWCKQITHNGLIYW